MTRRLEISPLTVEDLPRLLSLEQACFSDPWSESMMRSTLETPVVRGLAARVDGELVGFALAYLIPPEGEIADICVSPEARGQGIAFLLMQALMEGECSEFWLEVRASNTPARRLYEKLGFVPVGIRRNYYDSPREDAIVMRCDRGERE